MTPTRRHRFQVSHPDLWRAVDGAIRDAQYCHPEIEIPDMRRPSIVKRVVGAVLALERAGVVAETTSDD